MSSETLRRAATKARRLAEAATPGPWIAEVGGSEGYYVFGPRGLDERFPMRRARTAAVTWGTFESDKANAEHIASWHPGVAFAVADLLEWVAFRCDNPALCADLRVPQSPGEVRTALAVARAYLGETS